jgi:hypothetical protein
MYVVATRWRGTSPIFTPRTARQIRGLGDTVVTDPVTGEQKVVTSAPITSVTVTPSGQDIYQDSSGNVFAIGQQSGGAADVTSWINNNAGKIALGVGAVFALMILGRMVTR